MAAILENVTNCIWHAFHALQNSEAVVHKSKLKVLTANIGTLLDLNCGVEKGLDHYRPEQVLTFDEYRSYLQKEVFSSLPSTTPLTAVREYEGKISEVCWLVCWKSLVSRERPVFDENSVFKLFRVFCLLADLVPDSDDEKEYMVILQPSEGGIVAEMLVHCLGLRWDPSDWDTLGCAIGHFKWSTFLTVLETKYCQDDQLLQKEALVEAVDEVYDVFIEDIIKKGYLFKRGYLLPTMREYWCVLQPFALTYYKSSAQKEQCGRIPIDQHCSVEATTGDGKLQKFHIVTPERTFDFATQDHKSRLQWVSSVRRAVSLSGGAEGFQRGARAARRGVEARRERDARDARHRLQREVRARLAAEVHTQKLAETAEEDHKKLEEMRAMNELLQKNLLEEQQAKKDEETVRAFQARVLAEEWEKREELEKIQAEQEELLEEERLKRKQYEIMHRAKEAEMQEAKKRLQELEQEKKRLDEELRAAQEKMRHTNALQVHLRDFHPLLKPGERARRAVSFIPTTKSSSDTLIDVRAIRHLKTLDIDDDLS